MVVDHERAWHRLASFIADKPHHGSQQLLAEMQRILTLPDVQVPEGGQARALRLYGVEVAKAEARQRSDAGPTAAGGSSPGGMVPRRDHERPEGHDGGSSVEGRGAPDGAAGGSRQRVAA